MKRFGKIVYIYIFIFLICVGASFAWYVWKGDNVNVNVTFSSVDKYINYETSVDLNGNENGLTPSENYSSGVIENIDFVKKENAKGLDLLGNLYLKIDGCNSNNTSSVDENVCGNLFKASSLEWTLVSIDGDVESVVSTGNFVGETIGNEIPIYNNFQLKEDIMYKVYIWINSNVSNNVTLNGLTLNTSVISKTVTNDNDDASMTKETYVRSIKYSGVVIDELKLYSSVSKITGYIITNTLTKPSADEIENNIDANSIEKILYPNYAMDDVNNICFKTEDGNVECKVLNKNVTVVDKASLSKLCNNSVYSGSEQELAKNNNVGYTLSNNIGEDAGTYTITASLKDGYVWDGNSFADVNFTCDISKRDVSITANSQTVAFGNSIDTSVNNVTASGLVTNHSIGSITLTPSTNNVTDNGTITPSDAKIFNNDKDVTNNYNITYNSGKLVVTKVGAVCPTVTAYSGEYDGNSHTITVSGGSGGTIQYRTSTTGTWSTTKPTRAVAGTTTVYVQVVGDNNHSTTDCGSKDIAINKKPLTITASDQSISYGSSIATGVDKVTTSGLISGHVLTSITLTASTTIVTTSGVITPSAAKVQVTNTSGADVTTNYDIAYRTGTLVITKVSATCPTLTAYSGEYDSYSHTITVSGGNGGTIQYRTSTSESWSTTKPSRIDAGTTTVYVQVAGDSNHNTIDCGNRLIDITQKALTITASAQTINYGSSIATGVGKVTTSGLISGHVLTSITLNASTANVTTSGTITPSGAKVQVTNTSGADVTSNYNITYKTGTLTINKVAATCPTVTAYSGTYDNASHTVTVSGGSGGTIQYRTSTTGTWSTTKPTRTAAGTTTVYVQVAGDSNHNTTDCGNKTITIGKRALTITASAQTINYGSSIATGVDKVTTSGLVNGHVLTSITLSASTTSVTTSGTITPSGAKVQVTNTSGADVTTNYNITYQTGKLTINKVAATCPTITAYSGTYDNSSHTVTVSGGSGGTIQYRTSTTGTWSTTKPTRTAAGTTTVYVQVAGDSNHNTTDCGSKTITISKKALTITASAQTINYGSSIATGTGKVTTSGLLSNHVLTSITLSASTTSATTSGTITPSGAKVQVTNTSGADVTTNYNITYKTGTLTINKVNATCPTVTAYSGTYNGSSHTVTVSGGSGGTIQYRTSTTGTWSTTKPTRTSAGTTTVYVQVAGDGNHNTVDCGNKTITINKKALTITASAQTINYGSSIATGTDKVTTSGLVSGHVLTSITLSASTTSVTTSGTITPSAAKVQVTNTSGSTVTTNYSITYKTGTLTINKVAATCPTVTAYSGTYDGSSHTVTVSGGSGGTIQYRTSTTGTWSTTKPTRTSAGTTTVYVQVAGDSNHNTTDCGSKAITISKAKTATTGSCYSRTYNNSSQTLAGGGNYVSYTNNSGTNAGSYTVTVKSDSNHLFSDSTSSKTLSCSIGAAYPYLSTFTISGTKTDGTGVASTERNVSSGNYKNASTCTGNTCTTFSSSEWLNTMSFSWSAVYTSSVKFSWNASGNYTGSFSSTISGSESKNASDSREINSGGKRLIKITLTGTTASGGKESNIYVYFAVNGGGYINGSLADGWFTENDYYYYRRSGSKVVGSTASGTVSAFWLTFDSTTQYYSFKPSTGENVYAWLRSNNTQYNGYSKMAAAISTSSYGTLANTMYYGTKQPIYFTNGSVRATTGNSSSSLMGLVIVPTTGVYYKDIYTAATNIAFASKGSSYYACWYDKVGDNDVEYTCQ